MISFAETRKENDEIGLLPLKMSHHLSAVLQKGQKPANIK